MAEPLTYRVECEGTHPGSPEFSTDMAKLSEGICPMCDVMLDTSGTCSCCHTTMRLTLDGDSATVTLTFARPVSLTAPSGRGGS